MQMAIAEAQLGNRRKARAMLVEVVRREPGYARAWYLLSQVMESPVQAVDCLIRVLEIDPNNAAGHASGWKGTKPTRRRRNRRRLRRRAGRWVWLVLLVVACLSVPLCVLGAAAGYGYV